MGQALVTVQKSRAFIPPQPPCFVEYTLPGPTSTDHRVFESKPRERKKGLSSGQSRTGHRRWAVEHQSPPMYGGGPFCCGAFASSLQNAFDEEGEPLYAVP